MDIGLRRNGELFLVQCKNWNRNRVGVGVVREMCGVKMDEGAAGVVIVYSGHSGVATIGRRPLDSVGLSTPSAGMPARHC